MPTLAKRSRKRIAPTARRTNPGPALPLGERRNARRPKRVDIGGRMAVALDLDLTGDSLVRRCLVRLRARRAEATPMVETGDLRVDGGAASGQVFVVDFGVLRTVSGVAVPSRSRVLEVRPWSGLAFGDSVAEGERRDPHLARFSEIQTQRLQIRLKDSLTRDEMAAAGALLLPGPPADLALALGGEPPLFTFPGRIEPGDGEALSETDWNRSGERLVDLTEAVAAAYGDSQDPDSRPLSILLTAGAPGELSLRLEELVVSRLSRVHIDGVDEKVLDHPVEEHRALSLSFARDARLEGLRLRVSGEHEAERVIDPAAPPASSAAELLADPHRSFALRLPPLEGLSTLAAVRLPLRAEASAEARLTLWLAPQPGRGPEESLAEGVSEPVTLEAATSPVANNTESWTTFRWPRALELAGFLEPAGAGDLWAALDVVRGSVVLELTEGGGAPAIDSLRRGTPRGDWRRLPAVFAPGGALNSLGARLRVAGAESEENPRLPLRIGLAGGSGAVDLDPAGGDLRAELVLTQPLAVTAKSSPRLMFTAYSAGSTRLEDVDLVWSPPPPLQLGGGRFRQANIALPTLQRK